MESGRLGVESWGTSCVSVILSSIIFKHCYVQYVPVYTTPNRHSLCLSLFLSPSDFVRLFRSGSLSHVSRFNGLYWHVKRTFTLPMLSLCLCLHPIMIKDCVHICFIEIVRNVRKSANKGMVKGLSLFPCLCVCVFLPIFYLLSLTRRVCVSLSFTLVLSPISECRSPTETRHATRLLLEPVSAP